MKPVHILIAVLLAAGAAQANAQGMSMPSAAAPFVNAEIVKADAANGKVTLKHENIPNLDMPAMTMAFPVADKRLLMNAKAGDKIFALGANAKGVVYFQRQYVWKMETGRVAPSLSALAHFARRLDVPLADLLRGI